MLSLPGTGSISCVPGKVSGFRAVAFVSSVVQGSTLYVKVRGKEDEGK